MSPQEEALGAAEALQRSLQAQRVEVEDVKLVVVVEQQPALVVDRLHLQQRRAQLERKFTK